MLIYPESHGSTCGNYSHAMPVEGRTVHIPLENGKDLSVTVQDLVDVILIDNPELLNKLKLHKGLQKL